MLRDDIAAYLVRIDFESSDRLRRARDIYYLRPDTWAAQELAACEYYEKIIHKICHDIYCLLQKTD